ncbi:MAG: cobalamin-dependent protein, partial [Planctomycetales bacterium]|nr:cobalamin-dependent protein [Planctomycetales bacterium]
NNYEIVDLGVMVACDDILNKAVEEGVDIVGLSGLITPSLDEMVHVAKEMQRRGMTQPLLIGGATTSAKHTAVRIAPRYSQPVLHVLDASRAVGVVDRLVSSEHRSKLVAENVELQRQLVDSYEKRQVTLVPYKQACEQRFASDWQAVDIPTPSFIGTRVIDDLPLAELVDYIDWSPFFMAWELKGKYPKILDDPTVGAAARELYQHARELLDRIMNERLLTARAVYGFWPANSAGDDIVLYQDVDRKTEAARFHTLRQQWERKGQADFRALADYIAPIESGRVDYLGAFAVTTGLGADELAMQFHNQLDDYNSIMTKALADRLAEAFAEYLHARARREWGYGANESLSNDQLIDEQYRGIRPAFGYPAQPDHTEKAELFRLLDATKQTGITLTESFAMHPAASVSGLYFAHPDARYFALDRITREQVESYAARKGMSIEEVERWLAPNLGYDA